MKKEYAIDGRCVDEVHRYVLENDVTDVVFYKAEDRHSDPGSRLVFHYAGGTFDLEQAMGSSRQQSSVLRVFAESSAVYEGLEATIILDIRKIGTSIKERDELILRSLASTGRGT